MSGDERFIRVRKKSQPDAAAQIADDAPARGGGAEVVRFLLLPTVFLTTALLGGVRFEAGTGALALMPPPLVALVLAALLCACFVRAGAVRIGAWLSESHAPAVNIAHALTLLTLYAAAAQTFNSVLPERGLPRVLLALFFLWTLWNNLFAGSNRSESLRSIVVLFATAFAVKHFLLASLFDRERSALEQVAARLAEGVSFGALSAPAFAPATGYVSLLTVALFISGLWLMPRTPEPHQPDGTPDELRDALNALARLTPAERKALRELLRDDAPGQPVAQSSESSAISSRSTS